MMNLTSSAAGLLLLLNFVLSDAARPQKAARVESPPAPALKIETREYRARNGRSLAVTSLGNFVRLGGRKVAEAAPVRDGYRLTYKNPLDGGEVSAFAGGAEGGAAAHASSELVPVSFEAPAAGAVLRDGETLTAKVTVRTRDGLLRLTHLITWEPDKDSLGVRTDIANSGAKQAVPAVVFARTIDVRAEDTKAAAHAVLKYDTQTNVLLMIRCKPGVDCPPPPPVGPAPVGPGDPVTSIADGATRASLTWRLPLSEHPSAPATTRYSLRDGLRP